MPVVQVTEFAIPAEDEGAIPPEGEARSSAPCEVAGEGLGAGLGFSAELN